MAKAPKAVGKNGASTPKDVLDGFVQKAVTTPATRDSYWGSQVVLRTIEAVTLGFGEEHGRQLVASLKGQPWRAEGLGWLASGHARAGRKAEAEKALKEAVEAIKADAIDGEIGTLAWSAIASARKHLGDEKGTDKALNEAEACAKREKSNPTQPWPHYAQALAGTHRHERLLTFLESIPKNRIAFGIEDACERAITSATERGDDTWLKACLAFLSITHTHAWSVGIVRGARRGLEAGHGAALVRVVAGLDSAWGKRVLGSELATIALALGQRDVAIAFAEIALAEGGPDGELSDVLFALGLHAHDKAAAVKTGERASPQFSVGHYATLLRGDTQARLLGRWAERFASLDAPEAAAAKVHIGAALRMVGGDAGPTSLLAEGLNELDTLPKSQSSDRRWKLEAAAARLADADLPAEVLWVGRKLTSKYDKAKVFPRLANLYAKHGDYAGALLAIGMIDSSPLKNVMSHCDLLCDMQGLPGPFVLYA